MNGNGNLISVSPLPNIMRCDGAMLQKHWPFLRGKLELIKVKAEHAQKKAGLKNVTATWIPEQIRMAVLKGLVNQNTVELYVVFDDSERPIGFFITSCPPDEFVQVPLILHLWMVWSGRRRLIEECEPFVDELAQQRGCLAKRHTSGRQGWLRRNPAGWKMSQIIYQKDIV